MYQNSSSGYQSNKFGTSRPTFDRFLSTSEAASNLLKRKVFKSYFGDIKDITIVDQDVKIITFASAETLLKSSLVL